MQTILNLITRRRTLQGMGTVAAVGAGSAAFAQNATPATIAATIDTARTGNPISRNMYGALQEHIGGLINTNLWSEVLDDRKFYYAVDNKPLPSGGRNQGHKWNPIGPESTVSMDTVNPYVGDHSPVVALAPDERRGLQQMGLALAAKTYTGRIVAMGDPGARVSVTLIWGDGPGARQSVNIPVAAKWATIPLKFTCRAETATGRIEIAGTGSGSLRVGAVSLMPADNIKGFRAEVIALLHDMKSGFWRMPGGNYVSSYDWKNAIGDHDRRPPVWDPSWNALQPNDVGTDEILTFCQLIGVEPYLCVNTGYGSPREGAELVEYVNAAPTTPMGALRARNGHPQPYRVKWWNVGNEMYGFWQLGHMEIEYYVIKHNMFAREMRKVDPSIVIIASGAMPDEMTITGNNFSIDPHSGKVRGKIGVEAGSPNDWTGNLIKGSWGNFDLISEHCYGDARRYDLATGAMVPVTEPVLDSVQRGANRIRLKREYWDAYQKLYPQLAGSKVSISVDEWGFRGAQGLRQALAIGRELHEMFRNSDLITMAGFTMGTSWLSLTRTAAAYSVAGLLFRLYIDHFGTIPVEVGGSLPQPAPKWPVGGDQPRVNAGSPTYPLDLVAALSADRASLSVAVINATATVQPLAPDLRGFAARPEGRAWTMSGTSLAANNRVGEAPQVTVQDAAFDAGAKSLPVAPYSVAIYVFTRAG